MFGHGGKSRSQIVQYLMRSRSTLAWVGLFSAVVNILGLTGSLYMLEVYDRVLASRSVPTLVAISTLALGLFILMGLLDSIRSQVLSRVGTMVERDLLKPVHDLVPKLAVVGRRPSDVTQPVRDLETLRGFISGPAPLALLDLPWMPLYLAFVFLLHPILGWVAVAGMLVMIALTFASDTLMRKPTLDATMATARRQQAVETTRRNAEVLRAMGFEARAAQRFYSASDDLFKANERATDFGSALGTFSKTFRIVLQSAILGIGAYLVIRGEMSAGAIIASSILSARAMAPIDMAVGSWKTIIAARQAKARLDEMLSVLPPEPERIQLPRASHFVSVEDVAVGAPGTRNPLIRNAKFRLNAGDGLAIIGPSGAGKSTLARALVGAWPTLVGAVRLDGAPLQQWPIETLGSMIGYLPQDVELFDGTIAANIARLDPNAEDADVVAAAQIAQVHEMILKLPQGYATMLGEGGHNLSVGQRQRIGLARALYRNPFFVVLDEPNAHLDEEGERALATAIIDIRRRGGIVAVVSHRPGIMSAVNLVAVVVGGEIKAFGPRENFLKRENALAEQKPDEALAAERPRPISASGGTR